MAVALLTMRQHRLATTRQMVELSKEIEADRQVSWQLQMKIERQLERQQFRQSLSNAAIRLESSAAPAAPAALNIPQLQIVEDDSTPQVTNVAAAN